MKNWAGRNKIESLIQAKLVHYSPHGLISMLRIIRCLLVEGHGGLIIICRSNFLGQGSDFFFWFAGMEPGKRELLCIKNMQFVNESTNEFVSLLQYSTGTWYTTVYTR